MTKKDVTRLPLEVAQGMTPEMLRKRLHSFEGRLAEFISEFAGSMPFVYLHAVWFAAWILINEGLVAQWIEPFDPFPYGLLTMVVSLEAIFLATFILINQNRQALIDEYHELEEEKEQEEEEAQQEELEGEIEDVQKDLEDIKSALSFIQQKVSSVEKSNPPQGNGGKTSK